jgi:hypothetical protein
MLIGILGALVNAVFFFTPLTIVARMVLANYKESHDWADLFWFIIICLLLTFALVIICLAFIAGVKG